MSLQSTAADLEAKFGLRAYVCAQSLSSSERVGHRQSDLAVTASVFKVPVLLEALSQVAAGEIEAEQRVLVKADDYRVLGGTGIASFAHDVELSFRDLCLSMMQVSDNRATDVVMEMVGWDRINARLRSLGLEKTVVEGDCRDLFATIDEDEQALADGRISESRDELGAPVHLRALDPKRASRTTAEECTELLRRIWQAEDVDPEVSRGMREMMAEQVWRHRLSAGFPGDDITIAGKTGTLRHVRNEVGVVEYPDGQRYAVSVFLRIPESYLRVPHADQAIGTLGAAAVAELRGEA